MLQAAEVVAVLRLAVFCVEAPAADAAADDHSFGVFLGHHDLGRDRVALVLVVDDRVFAQPAHPAKQ
jgi:hypothetical protein